MFYLQAWILSDTLHETPLRKAERGDPKTNSQGTNLTAWHFKAFIGHWQ